jgi:hypothetical protein
MRIRYLAAVLAVVFLSCSEITSTNGSDLVGAWRETQSLQSRGSYQRTFTFQSNGQFTARGEYFGLYDSRKSLSAYDEIRGHFEAANGRLQLIPHEEETWDSLLSPTPTILEATFWPGFDDCAFEISGARVRQLLTLTFTSAHLDAPLGSVIHLYLERVD